MFDSDSCKMRYSVDGAVAVGGEDVGGGVEFVTDAVDARKLAQLCLYRALQSRFQRQRAQVVDDGAQRAGGQAESVQHAGDLLLQARMGAAGADLQQRQLDLERQQMLAKVVVDVARDAIALVLAYVFLLMNQPAQAGVAVGQRMFGQLARLALDGDLGPGAGQLVTATQVTGQQAAKTPAQQHQPQRGQQQHGLGRHRLAECGRAGEDGQRGQRQGGCGKTERCGMHGMPSDNDQGRVTEVTLRNVLQSCPISTEFR
jgi:hypothetical protein